MVNSLPSSYTSSDWISGDDAKLATTVYNNGRDEWSAVAVEGWVGVREGGRGGGGVRLARLQFAIVCCVTESAK